MDSMSSGNATPDVVSQSLISPETRPLFAGEIDNSGLVKPDGTVAYSVDNDPGPVTTIAPDAPHVIVLNSGATTFVSTSPLVIGLGPDASTSLATVKGQGVKAQGDTVVGGTGSNYIIGNTARDLLVAGTGSETIQSGHGRDTIQGGSGSNTLIGGGKSLIEAGSGPTSITAGADAKAHDTIFAGSGSDTISLTSGKNTVVLGTGHASIQAGSGQDIIIGSTGPATIASGATTTVSLGKGDVTLNVPTGNNASVNDTVYGGAHAGDLKLNVASTAATITQVSSTNQDITFGNGSVIHTSGHVHIIFSDGKTN